MSRIRSPVIDVVSNGRLTACHPGMPIRHRPGRVLDARRCDPVSYQPLELPAPPVQQSAMRILIMGGGVVGVTTAYQLLRDGHEVVLLERQDAVARETSWGNAGMIAPGHSFVWSSPRAPRILLKSLFRKDQALRFRFSADPRLYRWSLQFLAECTAAKARRNTLLKHRLAVYSQRVLREVIAAEALDYDRNARGILYFHRDQAALEAASRTCSCWPRRPGDPRARPRAGAGTGAGVAGRRPADRRRHLLPDRRDRRFAQIHPRAGRTLRRAGRGAPHRHDDQRDRDVGRCGHGGARRRADVQGRQPT